MGFDIATALKLPTLPHELTRVETELNKVLKTTSKQLSAPLERLMSVHGKRLRPSLVIATAASQGKAIDNTVIRACTAIELIHLASLVHDDVIDNAATRWNIPTIHKQEGSGVAIVVGDYLLARAFQTAATINTEAATIIGTTIARLCEGQAAELAAQYDIERSQDSLMEAITGKTASLMAAACHIGALCSNATAAETTTLITYGTNLGIAFQLIDDLLDLISTPELFGKPVGNDIPEGVYTMSLIFGLAGAHQKALKQAVKTKDTDTITRLLIADGSIKRSIDEIKQYNQQAEQALGKSERLAGLRHLPRAYFETVMTQLVAVAYKKAIAFEKR